MSKSKKQLSVVSRQSSVTDYQPLKTDKRQLTTAVKRPGRPVSPRAHGPVFEIRMALADQEGAPVSRAELARRVKCSLNTIQRAELAGTLPCSRAIQANLQSVASCQLSENR